MSPETSFDDEIDIRPIIQTLWRLKWWIIAITAVFGVVALLGSKFLLPKGYEVKAYVVVNKPNTTVNLENSIQSSPQIPDAKSLLDLTVADDLVYRVKNDPQVVELMPDLISLESFRKQLKPSLVGSNQLTLKVSDSNPNRAAIVANIWAHEVSMRLNDLFGSNNTELQSIQNQTDQARLDWDISEQALLDYMQDSKLESLTINLVQGRSDLTNLLLKINSIDLLISDAQALKLRLENSSANSPVSLETALNLITLHQNAVGELTNIQIQLLSDTIQTQDMNVLEVRKSLDELISALHNQNLELQDKHNQKAVEVTALAANYEQVRYQIDLLQVKRDLAKEAYQALSTHLVEIQILTSRSDQVAIVAGEAYPPDKPSSPNTRMNTLVGAAFGLFLSTGIILVWSWWKSPADNE